MHDENPLEDGLWIKDRVADRTSTLVDVAMKKQLSRLVIKDADHILGGHNNKPF